MDVEEAVRTVRSRIEASARRSGRDPDAVTVVAVTKTVPVELIREAQGAGIENFAENYANDLSEKARVVPATWHFIGKLQAGTASRVADHADWIHSAEPGRALEKVARRAARRRRAIRCLVQVDLAGGRQGVEPGDLESALGSLRAVEGIRLLGLMTIAPWTEAAEGARPYFRRLRDLRDGLRDRHPELEELSMGMSGDYEVAVEEGATMLRIGTALFGPRPAPGRPG